MSQQEAMEQYQKALKVGQKCYRSAILHGKYPYPQVLDEILDESMNAGRFELGLVEIPTEQIVGTKTVGRKSTFAANFMPLMPPDTEFAGKWIQLCKAHLSIEGIRDPRIRHGCCRSCSGDRVGSGVKCSSWTCPLNEWKICSTD